MELRSPAFCASVKVGRVIAFAMLSILPAVLLASCASRKSDLRSAAPLETLVYIEVPDVGKLFSAITSNESFRAASAKAKDLSVLNGVEAAVAVTGLEASESRVTDEEAVMNLKPAFILIAETHLWSWQMPRLVEGTLGAFVNGAYGGGASLDKSLRADGDEEWYVWTARDGRRAFAAVKGSRVYFGNSEDGVKRCIDVAAGKAPSLFGNERLSRQYESADGKLAFGYVGADGIKRLSSFAGISFALEGASEAGAQSVISSILPQFIDKSVSEIVWTAVSAAEGIRDELTIRLVPDLAEAFSEAFRPESAIRDKAMFSAVPPDSFSVTRYNLKDPRLAFRSLVIGAAGKVSPEASRFVPAIGASLLEPYGIEDAEGFLAASGPFLLTARLDADGDKSIAIVESKDPHALSGYLVEGLRNGSHREFAGVSIVSSKDGLAAGFADGFIILGDVDSVERSLRSLSASGKGSGKDIRYEAMFAYVRRPEHTSVTVGKDGETPAGIAGILGDGGSIRVSEDLYEVRTDFDATGMRRTYVSPFGFAGTLITQFGGNR